MAFTDIDPTELAKVVGASLGSMLVMAYPLMKLLRIWNTDRKDSSKDISESKLYEHLSEQVRILSESLDKSRNETSKLITEMAHLKSRLAVLETHEEVNKKLKEKLDSKDKEIQELSLDLGNYRKRLRTLEHRLAKFETVTDFMPTGDI